MSTSSTNLSITLQTGSEGKTTRLTVLNANWNIIDALFHQTTGHSHDGTAGEGPKISPAELNPAGTTDGQVLTSTGSATDPAFEAAPGTTLAVRNETGGTLAVGKLVYASGWDEDETSWLISLADANVAGAANVWVLQSAISNNANGTAHRTHRFTSQNTSAGSLGDRVYLSETAGAWTLTKPTASGSVALVVGRVAVDHSSAGVVEINPEAGALEAIGSNEIQADAVITAKINDDAVTLAKLASGTDGELITWDASGNPAAVAVGTSTHLLTSNGAGAAPTFQAAAAAGKVKQHSFVEGSSGGISTTSNSYVDITDMKRTITTTGGNLVCRLTLNIDCDNSGTYFYAAFQLDSASEEGEMSLQAGSNGETHCITLIYTFTSVSSAEHVVDGRWHTSSGNSLDCDNDERFMEVMEVST